MGKFTHYLITRFNVPVDNWVSDKAGLPVLDDTWFQHRISLFNQYCVPTVASQSEKNFQWLIYCDSFTKPGQLQAIKKSVSQIPSASIRLVENAAKMLIDLRQLLSIAPSPFLITSRMDNDDGLADNFIQTIQQHFNEKDKGLLNINAGIIYDVNEKVMTRMTHALRNHYGSLIEERKKAEDILTVLGFAHDQPPTHIHIENISGESYWLKIIHDRNLKSQLKGKPVFGYRHYFPIIPNDNFKISIWNTLKYIFKRGINKIN
jgi:hypothetical protein